LNDTKPSSNPGKTEIEAFQFPITKQGENGNNACSNVNAVPNKNKN
jgi:hypothetical protein